MQTVALAMAALAISAAAKPVSLYAAGGLRGALSTWRFGLVAVVLITLFAPASAAEEGGCDKFASLERDL